jgi:hypothetical protein
MADPLAIYKQQQEAMRAKAGEGVSDLSSLQQPKDKVKLRRPSKLDNLMNDSPPMSPATQKRRESKEARDSLKGDDVLGMLGIQKTDDILEFERKKQEAMMTAVNKFAHLLMRKKSPAELSQTKWRAIAKLFQQEKLTLDYWMNGERG